MSLPKSFQSIYLILASIFTFVWANNLTLSKFTIHLISLLLIFFLFHQLIFKRKALDQSVIKHQYTSNSIIITIASLLLVFNTGGLVSPWFFVINLLLFILSLSSSSIQGLTVSLALSLLFLLNTDFTTTRHLINLFSLILMTPLAMIFSTQYLKLLEAQNQIKVLKHQSKQLKPPSYDYEANILISLSMHFNNKLGQTLDLVSQLSSSLSHIPYHQKDNLNSVYQDLKALLESSQNLKSKNNQTNDKT